MPYEEINFEGNPKGIQDASKDANKALEGFEKAAVKANEGAQKAFDATGEAMVKVSSRSQSSINRIVASLERRAASAASNGDPLAALSRQRDIDLQRVAGEGAAVAKVEAAYRQLFAAQKQVSESRALESAVKASRAADKQGEEFIAALRSNNKRIRAEAEERAKAIEAANKASLKAAVSASRAADKQGEEFLAALRSNNARIKAEAAAREKLVQDVERQAVNSRGKVASLQFARDQQIQSLGSAATPQQIGRLNASYSELARNAKEAEIAGNKAVNPSSISSGIANIRKVAAVYASLALIIGGLAGAASAAVLLNDLNTKTELFFTKTFQSAGLAKQTLGEVKQIARDSSIFDFKSALEGAKQLSAFGFTAGQIPRVLRAIGDAASVLGDDRIQRITIALGQILTKGRVQAQELLQLQESGVRATEILAKAAGQTNAQFLKTVESGSVPAREAIRALLSGIEDEFGGTDKKFNELASGLVNQIVQAAQEVAAETGRIFDPAVRAGLKFLVDGFVGLRDALVSVNQVNPSKFLGFLLGFNTGTGALVGASKLVSGVTAEVKKLGQAYGLVGNESVINKIKALNTAVLPQVSADELRGAQDRSLKDAIAATAAENARAKAIKEAEKNAERLRDILRQLRDERQSAVISFGSADKDVERLNIKLFETKRRLSDLGASRADQAAAEVLIRQKFALDQLMEKRREADRERNQQFEKSVAADLKSLENIDALRAAEAKLAQERFDRVDRLFRAGQEDEQQSLIQAVDAEKRIRIAGLAEVNRKDVAGQIETVAGRLKIEIDYLQKKTELELEQINKRRAEELRILQDARTELLFRGQDASVVDGQIRSVQAIFDAQVRRKNKEIVDEKVILEAEAASRIQQIQVDAAQRGFDEWKSAFSRTLDALTTRFQGWGNFVKTLLTATLLAPAKEFAATIFAALATGQSPQRALANGGSGTGQSLGIFGTLFGLGAGGGGGFGPQFGSAATPGGTGTFTGAPIGGLGGGSGSGSSGLFNFAGFGQNIKSFKGLLENLGSLGKKNVFGGLANGKAVGGAKGGGLLLGGGILLADGIRRRSLAGAGEAAVGGALIGFKFGGPVGAAIGAAAGLGAGLVATLFKKGEDKAREMIKQVYGIEIREKNVLKLFLAIAKNNFGGDLRLAIASRESRELIETYKLTQGDKSGLPGQSGPRALSLLQSGGVLNRVDLPGGSNGTLSIGARTALQSPTIVQIQVDGASVASFFQGQTVTAIGNNPRAVADSAAAGQSSSFGNSAFSSMEPGTLFA